MCLVPRQVVPGFGQGRFVQAKLDEVYKKYFYGFDKQKEALT
jgi:hypothetical protein